MSAQPPNKCTGITARILGRDEQSSFHGVHVDAEVALGDVHKYRDRTGVGNGSPPWRRTWYGVVSTLVAGPDVEGQERQ